MTAPVWEFFYRHLSERAAIGNLDLLHLLTRGLSSLEGLTELERHAPSRATDRVYERLRDLILTGQFASGCRLSVPELARRLHVSRSPIREAVVRLVQSGLATEEPRRGAVVASISVADLVALYEIREALEGLAARLAVENSGRKMVNALAENLEEHQRAVRSRALDAHVELDVRFHWLVRQAGKNRDLIRFLDQIEAKVRLAMASTTVARGPQRALADHRDIYNAIAAGDAIAAEAAARAHVARLRETLEKQLPASFTG